MSERALPSERRCYDDASGVAVARSSRIPSCSPLPSLSSISEEGARLRFGKLKGSMHGGRRGLQHLQNKIGRHVLIYRERSEKFDIPVQCFYFHTWN